MPGPQSSPENVIDFMTFSQEWFYEHFGVSDWQFLWTLEIITLTLLAPTLSVKEKITLKKFTES